ncbi:MAG: hypothetical protein KJ047_14395 [Anaerolineae bacterium]|nr:hypothetical protein [Anaerolineae bacterium]MEB2288359.1 hypothetical protein [Anaerolineae bacterium]
MRKFLLVLIGLPVLAAAAGILWVAHGPQPSEARTTGGLLFTQAEIAAQNLAAPGAAPQLNAITDTTAGAMAVPVQPQFSREVVANLTPVAPSGANATPPGGGVTLDSATEVAVAPLDSAAGVPAPDGTGGMATVATGYEQRVIELEWPSQFQVGRAGSLRVTLKMLEGGALQPVAEIGDNEVVATPILLTDRYATHDAFVTATLSAPDFSISAVSPAVQQLQRGGEVTWRWTLRADSSQKAVIALGLSITWQPKPGQPSGPSNVALWSQTVQVDVNHVFGMFSVPQATIAGTVLGVLGFVAEMPLVGAFFRLLWRILFGRRRPSRDNRRGRR